MKNLLFVGSHVASVVLGIGLGVYFLPIAIAAHSPAPAAQIALHAREAPFHGAFIRDLKGSDSLHWGMGSVIISERAVSLKGELSPGPDYKLYLSPDFVETTADFERAKSRMVRVGDVRTFQGFFVPVSGDVDPRSYNTVVVWCETFHQFITSARYR